jgi:transposase
MEAMRALKRTLSDLVYRQLLTDALKPTATGPGGQPGNDSDSSAADSHPAIDSSDQPLPGPAGTQPKTQLLAAS